jgi:tetratricopeptide (TPR) repeat protein
MTAAPSVVFGQATPTPKPATASPNGANAANKAKNVDALLQQGIDALSAGQYQPAREAFQDVVALDPKNAKAQHGLALCMMAQKEVAKAAAVFDKGFTATTTPDRAMVLNAAACNMATRSHMRAAKVIKDYLTAHPKEADEQMVNALGTALQSATPQERKNPFFGQCASFYLIANQRLEAARPGYKRFGSAWLPAKEADAKAAAMSTQQKKLDSLADALATAQERFDAANKENERQKFLITKGEPPTSYYVRRAQYDYDNTKAALEAAQEKYDTFVASLERPKFPDAIELVAMDSTTAPPVATEVAVANTDVPEMKTIKTRRPRSTSTDTPPPTGAKDTGPETVVALEPPRRARGKVRITQYAAAFPISPELVVTSAAVVDDTATTMQLQATDGQNITAEFVRKDEATGLALLKVVGKKMHPLGIADAFNGGPVTCASFPSVDLFSPAAQSITGSATAPKDGWTVSLNTHPRLPGAPLMAGGKVVGVCVAARDAERNKLPAVTLDQFKKFLGSDLPTEPAGAGIPTASLLQLVTTRESGE